MIGFGRAAFQPKPEAGRKAWAQLVAHADHDGGKGAVLIILHSIIATLMGHGQPDLVAVLHAMGQPKAQPQRYIVRVVFLQSLSDIGAYQPAAIGRDLFKCDGKIARDTVVAVFLIPLCREAPIQGNAALWAYQMPQIPGNAQLHPHARIRLRAWIDNELSQGRVENSIGGATIDICGGKNGEGAAESNPLVPVDHIQKAAISRAHLFILIEDQKRFEVIACGAVIAAQKKRMRQLAAGIEIVRVYLQNGAKPPDRLRKLALGLEDARIQKCPICPGWVARFKSGARRIELSGADQLRKAWALGPLRQTRATQRKGRHQCQSADY